MRQRLEQVLYEVPRVQERERVYRVIDLDYLSASVLYTGPIFGDGGIKPFPLSDGRHIGGGSRPLGGSLSYKGISSSPLNHPNVNIGWKTLSAAPKEERYNLKIEGNSIKIFDPQKEGSPLTRLDLKPHEFKDIHLQHGENDYFGRKGKEAADIFGEIYRLNPKIKFPWEK